MRELSHFSGHTAFVQTSAKKSAVCIAGAVLLNILPWFGGPGWIWSFLLLGGAAWIAKGRPTQAQLVVWTLAVCAHALDNFYIGIGTLPWVAGAFFALRSVWSLFDASKIRRGYAPYAAIGSVLCLWTLFWTWGKITGWIGSTWMGGLDFNTHIDANGNSYIGTDYNATKWLMPIYSPMYAFTGRSLAGAFNASLVLLMLLGWTLWRDDVSRHRVRILPLAGALYLMVWVFPFLSSGYNGPIVFLLGALGIGFCTVMALRGQYEGKYDVADVTSRVKTEVKKRATSR